MQTLTKLSSNCFIRTYAISENCRKIMKEADDFLKGRNLTVINKYQAVGHCNLVLLENIMIDLRDSNNTQFSSRTESLISLYNRYIVDLVSDHCPDAIRDSSMTPESLEYYKITDLYLKGVEEFKKRNELEKQNRS